jgi:hypothetical protein
VSGPHRTVIRQTSSDSTHSTLVEPWETRRIRVAQGIQFHSQQIEQRLDSGDRNSDIAEHMGRYVQSKHLPGLSVDGNGNIRYESRAQRVVYEVTFTVDKWDFKRMLETENLLAVYAGHARHGLGPCFGDSGGTAPHFDGPTESWYDGNAGRESVTGLFRMGRRLCVMPVDDEIRPHGFSPRLVPYQVDSPLPISDCDLDLRAMYSELRPYTLAELGITHALHGDVDPDGIYWGVTAAHGGQRQAHAVVVGGWDATPAAPYDLGATEIKCRALFLIACRGYPHFHWVLREYKGWQRTAEGNDAYLLSDIGNLLVGGFWLHRLFTYPVMNAFHPWRGALEYAKQMANRDLLVTGQQYEIVTS